VEAVTNGETLCDETLISTFSVGRYGLGSVPISSADPRSNESNLG